MWRFTEGPESRGSLISLPGKMSESMTTDPPILSEACMILPVGSSWRMISLAPKAFLYQLMALAASATARYGVTVLGRTSDCCGRARALLADLRDFLLVATGVT